MKYNNVLLLCALSACASVSQAANLAWDNGAVDNVAWHVAQNWAGDRLPGSLVADKVILTGVVDSAYVVQAVSPLNPVDITVRENASLTISEDLDNIDDLLLGPNAGLDGGFVEHIAGLLSVNKLSVGNSTTASSDSSYEISGTGVLTTTGDLLARTGAFVVNGRDASVTVGNNLDLSLGGDLGFVLGQYEYENLPIDVTNQLKVNASSSKLSIDGSDYRGGSGTFELVRFNSKTASFAAGNIETTGFGVNQSAVVVQGVDSIDLVITTSAVSDSESQFWFSLIPSAGTSAGIADDLYLNNGHNASILGLSNGVSLEGSPDLSCVRSDDGNDLIYSITWTGNDYDDDGNADTFSFDLRVKGYTGTSYVYSATEGASSITSLGGSGDATEDGGRWGVGSDEDLDAGESLEFSIENISVSVPGFIGEVSGFTAFGLNELGGNSHQHIRGNGVGTGFDSGEVNFPLHYAFSGLNPLFVACAGTANSLGFQIDSLNFGMKVYDPSATAVWDVSDYSSTPDGIGYVEPYPAQTGNVSFPDFSWNTVPRWLAVRNQNPYSQAQINSIANNYQLVMLEKSNQNGLGNTELGIAAMAADLKAASSDIKILAYWNSLMLYLDYEASDYYDIANWSETAVDENGDVSFVLQRGELYRYNRSLQLVRYWWVDSAIGMVNDANIDGLFIDVPSIGNSYFYDESGNPTTDNALMFDDLRDSMPASKMFVGNSLRSEHDNGGRELMEVFDASYLERWDFIDRDTLYDQTQADVFVNSIQLMREALSLGKMINLQSGPEGPEIEANPPLAGSANIAAREDYAQKWVDFPLGVFLVIAESNAYFSYNMGVNAIEESYNDDVWDTSYLREFSRFLGAPNAAVKDGYVYTRSYPGVDVWLDVESKHSNVLWKTEIGSSSGSGDSNIDGDYSVTAIGDGIGGTSDDCYYMSTPHVGDFEVVTRIDSISNNGSWPLGSLMVRETLDDDSAHVSLVVRHTGRVMMWQRSSAGAGTPSLGGISLGNGTKWLKIVRAGDVFSGYTSLDGVTWTLLTTTTVSMGTVVDVGIAVSSDSVSSTMVEFGEFSIE